MILYGISGDEWEIEDHPFAKGGEGELHCVKGNDDLIIKLYKKGVLSNKGEKINYMATLYSEDRLKQLAWPIDAVKDQSGQTRGFVMKKFSTTEDMADLLDESSNKSMNLDWKKRIIVALNLSLLVRVRYIDRKNSVIRINAFTRLAGLFSILASIGGCLGAILWLFLRPPVYYPAELCVGFGLHSAGCALTLVAGAMALFIRKKQK